VKFAADKFIRFSKLRGALADCNARLDECQDAYIWREARERNFYSRFASRLDVQYNHTAFTGLIHEVQFVAQNFVSLFQYPFTRGLTLDKAGPKSGTE
jgi:hypothetical protein